MAQRGLLIVVEGCDRSGKSTQCEHLVTKLQHTGMRAELVKFPGTFLVCTLAPLNLTQSKQTELHKQAKWSIAISNKRAI